MSRFLHYVDRHASSWISRLEHNCCGGGEWLPAFRIFIGLFLLLFLAPYSAWLTDAPQGLFDPPFLSLARLFDGFPPGAVFQILDVLALAALAAITVGIRPRAATLVLLGVTIATQSFEYAFGKIDHLFILSFTLLCLAFTNWGTRGALIPDKPVSRAVQSTALGLAGMGVAFGMFSAGHEKLYRWIDFDLSTGGFVAWFYKGYLTLGRDELAASLIPHIRPQLFEAADYLAVLFELSAFVALFLSRRAWLGWLGGACLFHFANGLILNIPFLPHLPVYLTFLAATLNSSAPLQGARPPTWVIASTLLLLGTHLAQRTGGVGASFLFVTERGLERTLYLWGASLLWLAASALFAYGLLRSKPLNTSPVSLPPSAKPAAGA